MEFDAGVELNLFLIILGSILTSCPFRGQVYIVFNSLLLDLIVHILPDNLKEATGQALGERTVVVIDREAGFPDSHQIRPLHLSILCVKNVRLLVDE